MPSGEAGPGSEELSSTAVTVFQALPRPAWPHVKSSSLLLQRFPSSAPL